MASPKQVEPEALFEPDDVEDPNNVRPKILAASADCFSRYGVKKTTIDDISKKAGISRPTFYRFFENKQYLLLAIAIDETKRLREKTARLIKKIDNIDELFVEAILTTIVESQSSDVVQFLLSPENEDIMLKITESDARHWLVQTAGWQPLLELAKAEGRLRNNVTFDELAHWITNIETMFIIRNRAMKMPVKEMRDLIRRFVIPSILKDQ